MCILQRWVLQCTVHCSALRNAMYIVYVIPLPPPPISHWLHVCEHALLCPYLSLPLPVSPLPPLVNYDVAVPFIPLSLAVSLSLCPLFPPPSTLHIDDCIAQCIVMIVARHGAVQLQTLLQLNACLDDCVASNALTMCNVQRGLALLIALHCAAWWLALCRATPKAPQLFLCLFQSPSFC